jgi:hypothetical protein
LISPAAFGRNRPNTIGPHAEILERSVEYDRAWDEHFQDRPCVSLCLFIVRDVERDRRAAQLALTHDSVLSR